MPGCERKYVMPALTSSAISSNRTRPSLFVKRVLTHRTMNPRCESCVHAGCRMKSAVR